MSIHGDICYRPQDGQRSLYFCFYALIRRVRSSVWAFSRRMSLPMRVPLLFGSLVRLGFLNLVTVLFLFYFYSMRPVR